MREIKKYLEQNIDSDIYFGSWDAKKDLSLQMAGAYDFYIVKMLGLQFLLIKPKDRVTVKKIKTQIEYIKERSGFEVAIYLEKGTPYQIKKLLENRVPFIFGDQQLYLPFIALQIKMKNEIENNVKIHSKFTASTQLLYIYMLYQDVATFSAKELSDELGLSVMTVLRGMNELEQIGAVRHKVVGKTGRKKIFTRVDKKEYYRLGKGYLQNPVKETADVKYIPDSVTALKCGLHAIAEKTMLGEPARETYAVNKEAWAEFEELITTEFRAQEEGLPRVQFMKYDVRLLTEDDCVDPVTLIKSLDENDDRIEIAIKEMMRNVDWFEE